MLIKIQQAVIADGRISKTAVTCYRVAAFWFSKKFRNFGSQFL